MDTNSWARLSSSSSRRYLNRSGTAADLCHGDEFHGEEELRPEFICPFCAEEFDMLGLCCHIDEEHAIESKNGVCPLCAKKVGSDLIRHMTVQHANLLKVQRRRRRLRKVGSNLPPFFRKELREGHLQSIFGGSSFWPPTAESDPLLTSFISNSPLADNELPSFQRSSSIEACSSEESSAENLSDRTGEQSPPLSEEDLKEKSQRCEFVQGLLLSTFLYDDL